MNRLIKISRNFNLIYIQKTLDFYESRTPKRDNWNKNQVPTAFNY